MTKKGSLKAHKDPIYLQIYKTGGSRAMSVGSILPFNWLLCEVKAEWMSEGEIAIYVKMITERGDASST